MKIKIQSIIVCTLLISIIFSVEGNEFFRISENESITREEMIEIAEAFASFEWYPTEDNISPRSNLYYLFHSIIERIIQNRTILFLLAAIIGIKYVDTPDRNTHSDLPEWVGWKADQLNIGVPYQWGGFSSISGFNLTNQIDFEDQYTGTDTFEGNIHYAGDIYCDSQIISRKSCGVDCSGFVSRCWNLPKKQSTRTLINPEFSIPATFDELQMGDILIIPNYHVMLFSEFIDENKTQICVYEAGPCYKVGSWIYDVTNISKDRHSIELNYSIIYELYSYNADILS
jgi:hypothetical protein